MGDVVLCHGPKLQYARIYTPYNKNRKITEKEELLRYNFKRAVELWRLFSADWKALYNKFGYYSTKNRLSGYSLFLKEYLNMMKEFTHAETDMVFWTAMELLEAKNYKDYKELLKVKEEIFRQAIEQVLKMKDE